MGEQELEKYNQTIIQEKQEEEKLEKMIINLRKQQNKARLMPAKSHDLGTKRRKINKTEYITINEVWGRPEKTTSVKNKANSEPEQEPVPKKVKTKHEEPQITQIKEKITVLSTDIAPVPTQETELEEKLEPNKIGQELEDYETRWAKPIDWNKVIKEHRNRIEQEQQEIGKRK